MVVSSSDEEEQSYGSVIKVFATRAEKKWQSPWKTGDQWQTTGSAFPVDFCGEKRLITNAHCVANAYPGLQVRSKCNSIQSSVEN